MPGGLESRLTATSDRARSSPVVGHQTCELQRSPQLVVETDALKIPRAINRVEACLNQRRSVANVVEVPSGHEEINGTPLLENLDRSTGNPADVKQTPWELVGEDVDCQPASMFEIGTHLREHRSAGAGTASQCRQGGPPSLEDAHPPVLSCTSCRDRGPRFQSHCLDIVAERRRVVAPRIDELLQYRRHLVLAVSW